MQHPLFFVWNLQFEEMKEELIQTKTLSEQEHIQLFEWGTDIFGGSAQNLTWRPMELHFILKIEGNSVGHLGLIREQIIIDSKIYEVAGVGDLVTIPQMRGKGVARKLMNHATAFFFKEWKVDAGVLFCFERLVDYYHAMGWEIASNPVYVIQPSGKIRFPNQIMIFRGAGIAWREGTIEIGHPW